MASDDTDQPKKKLAPGRHQRLGKVNSEYRAKFLSPAQYLYKAGAWTHVKENVPNQVSLPNNSNSTPDPTILIIGSNWQLISAVSYYQSNFTINYLVVYQFSLRCWFVSHDLQTSGLSAEGHCPVCGDRKAATVGAIAARRKWWVQPELVVSSGVPWHRGGTGDLNRPEERAVISQYRELGLQGQIAERLNN